MAPGSRLRLIFGMKWDTFSAQDVRQLFPVVRQLVPASDLLIRDYTPDLVNSGWFVDRERTSQRHIYRYKADPYETVRQNNADYPYLWLLYLSKDRVGFADLPHAAGTRVL